MYAINSPSTHSSVETEQQVQFLLRVGKGVVEKRRCNQQGLFHHKCQTKSLYASESEGSPSKNIASNFQEMNSFGDAICLSLTHVAQAQAH